MNKDFYPFLVICGFGLLILGVLIDKWVLSISGFLVISFGMFSMLNFIIDNIIKRIDSLEKSGKK